MILDWRHVFSSPAIQMCLAKTNVQSPRPPAPTISMLTGAENIIDCIFMDQAGSGGEFLELGDKWYMGTVHDVTSPYDIR